MALGPSPIPINSLAFGQISSSATASASKAQTIVEYAQAIFAGDLDLESLDQLDDAAAIERLTRLRGIGRWTAEYVLLRGLGRLEIFPEDDVGAHNKLRRLFDLDTELDYDSVAAGSPLALVRGDGLLPPAARIAAADRSRERWVRSAAQRIRPQESLTVICVREVPAVGSDEPIDARRAP
jgi:3-methyladenine DNA glycosylase/8-oxoguanine DNA glycosylase